MITGVNEWKTLTKYVSCKCKYIVDSRNCNSKKWNISICRSECKNSKKHRVCGKDYIWNPARCGYEGEYVENIDLLNSCDETIDY